MTTPAALGALANGDTENFIAASTPGGIEAQEARGQKELVASQTLPKNCPKEQLEKLGFIFGNVTDDIFIEVEFPKGWSKKATDHSMWSDLLDEKGRKRGGIFYKAAFYDRSAHMDLNCRYSSGNNYDLENAVQTQVFDNGEVIFETEIIESDRRSNEYFDNQDKLIAKARKHIKDNYPDFANPLAYWD